MLPKNTFLAFGALNENSLVSDDFHEFHIRDRSTDKKLSVDTFLEEFKLVVSKIMSFKTEICGKFELFWLYWLFYKFFYKLLNNAFYGKTVENVRNRLKIKIIEKNDYREKIKQQSKLIFNGIHKSYENCDSYTFKQNDVLLDKPIYLGFSVLELSELLMYETYFDKLQPYLGQENIQLHYMGTNSFV